MDRSIKWMCSCAVIWLPMGELLVMSLWIYDSNVRLSWHCSLFNNTNLTSLLLSEVSVFWPCAWSWRNTGGCMLCLGAHCHVRLVRNSHTTGSCERNLSCSVSVGLRADCVMSVIPQRNVSLSVQLVYGGESTVVWASACAGVSFFQSQPCLCSKIFVVILISLPPHFLLLILASAPVVLWHVASSHLVEHLLYLCLKRVTNTVWGNAALSILGLITQNTTVTSICHFTDALNTHVSGQAHKLVSYLFCLSSLTDSHCFEQL